MYYLASTLDVADPDGFIEGVKAYTREANFAQEDQNEWGVVEHEIYRGVDQNIVIIVNGYKTLEAAQKHQAHIGSPETREVHAQMGVKSYELWLTEKRVEL